MSYRPGCEITEYPGEVLVLRFRASSDNDFIQMKEHLKDVIPPSRRRWVPEHKLWAIDPDYRAELMRWAHTYFSEHQIRYRRVAEAPQASAPPQADPWEVLHLRETAPPELVKAAFRCLAQLHHPDHGGDEVTMKRINNAFEALTSGAA